MPTATPNAVSALVFYVADLQRTEQFYRDVLHLDLSRMEADDDHPAILSGDVGALTLVFIETSEDPPGRSPVVVFGLEGGIEDAVDALVRQNVEIVAPISEAPGGGLTADFLDPDNHTLSYHQPAGLPTRLP
ncbi:MAG: VOC family protein [Bacteroidota bacterium]